MVQLDHLSGEDAGWALEALDYPGIRNRNIIPTLTKKGRMGYLLLLDIDPEAEADVGDYLLTSFTTHGYHCFETRHVHRHTKLRTVDVVVAKEDRQLTAQVRLKHDEGNEHGPYFAESDDLFALHRRIKDELGCNVFPREIRSRIEIMAADKFGEKLYLNL